MKPEQLEELKQAAMKATPGPWDFDTAETPYRIAGGEVVGGDALPWGVVYTTDEYETPDGTESIVVAAEIGCDNGRFVARANPSAILSLIAQVEALTVPQWQPIETAPRDGTLILLGRAEDEENDRGAISTPGRWHDGDDDGPDNMGHDAGFMDDEFQQFAWGRSFGNSAYKNGGFQPTHWMPLPAAPTIPAIPGTKEGA